MSCFRWSMGEISSHGIECLPASSVARSVTHVPGLFCYPCPWTAPIADNTGIRKHNIELALLLLDLSKEAFDVGDVRHVSLHAGDISSDFLDGCGQFRAAAPGD